MHELVHLLESTQNARFVDLMNGHTPDCRHRRQVLKRLPFRHKKGEY